MTPDTPAWTTEQARIIKDLYESVARRYPAQLAAVAAEIKREQEAEEREAA